MNLKVCKFGGTSMADKNAVERVKEIIRCDKSRRFVVVSAPGKRFKEDLKVTDLLYSSFAHKNDAEFDGIFDKIRKRFTELVLSLHLTLKIEECLDEIERGIKENEEPDFAASRGEFLMAKIMAEYLGLKFIDAKDIIKFNENGEFDGEKSNELVAKTLSIKEGAVIAGFYGETPDKKIKTFTRGGSDFTGAIVARGVMADVYENWTDVDGFMTADPRIIGDPVLIDRLSYEELRELSYMGASVLHPDSTFPLQGTRIPINIKNTFNPSAEGTLIVKDTLPTNGRLITGIAGHKGFTTILIKKSMMNAEIGFGRKILSVLESYGISMEHMPTGIDTLSLVIPDIDLKDKIEFELIEKIRDTVKPDLIFVRKDIALIAIVGHGMSNKAGTAAKVFTALAQADINVKMIDQGSSEINIIVGVASADMDNAIRAIYYAFFGKNA